MSQLLQSVPDKALSLTVESIEMALDGVDDAAAFLKDVAATSGLQDIARRIGDHRTGLAAVAHDLAKHLKKEMVA